MADKEQELIDELEAVRAELERLKREKEDLIRELESRNAAITELEQIVASKDSEIVALKQAMTESDKKLADISNALAQAVASYKALVVETNPEVPAELITGDTIDAVNESLENAKALIDRVRQGIEEEALKTKVPAWGSTEDTSRSVSSIPTGEDSICNRR